MRPDLGLLAVSSRPHFSQFVILVSQGIPRHCRDGEARKLICDVYFPILRLPLPLFLIRRHHKDLKSEPLHAPSMQDMEKHGQNGIRRGSGGSPTSAYEGALVSRKDGFLKRTWDGFKRDPNASITRPAALGADGKVFDVEAAAQRTADSPLARRLKGRHLQMIAIGGSIGEKKHPTNIYLFSERQTLTAEKVLGSSLDLARPSQRGDLPHSSSPFH